MSKYIIKLIKTTTNNSNTIINKLITIFAQINN
ncbi:hypothetical protein HNQ03_000840 [Chryseobacterium sp. 16F]|uniref:Uncharacterized protein n=1 Tax=Frigoriflavimonas asaccharolytica TaxID=2735899 RepID=A0A8J8K7A5_9FLAO|nr:hypothetical protein [Frigoriflavimonas asaccharolytica]